MTRGPSGSTVRSNIATDGTGRASAARPSRRTRGVTVGIRAVTDPATEPSPPARAAILSAAPAAAVPSSGWTRSSFGGGVIDDARQLSWLGGPDRGRHRGVLDGEPADSARVGAAGGAIRSGSAGVRAAGGSGGGLRRHRDPGRRRPPDPRRRGRQVQRRDGPHRATRRRRLEPGPLRRPPVRLRERRRQPRRLYRARARGRRLRAGVPEPRAQGLRLHHRHIVRLHGPDGDRRRGVPGRDVPAPDRLQVERQELRQLLRRHGGHEVPRGHARRLPRQGRRQPQARLHGDFPDPRGAAPGQRDHAGRQGDLPRMHDGRALHQHLARPGQGERRCGLAVRRGRAGRLHRRRHAGRRRRRAGEGQVGRDLRPSRARARSMRA